MKVLGIIKKVVKVIILTVFFVYAIFMSILLLNINKYGVTQIDNISFVILREELSSDKYKKGDLLLIESKKINRINEGDEIFVYVVDSTGIPSIDLGIIAGKNIEKNYITFKNGSAYDMQFVIGETVKVYNGIGLYLSFLQSTWGFLFTVLIPVFLIFIYQVYALIIEIKFGDQEEMKEKIEEI